MRRRLTFQQRMYVFISLTVTLAILATGWLTNQIATKSAKENAYKINQDMLDIASRALDERIEKFKLAIYAMKVSTEYRSMFQFESPQELNNYETRLSTLQSTFIQLMLAEPWIDSILLHTPDGEYSLLPQHRQLNYPFFDSPLNKRYQRDAAINKDVWIEEHQDPLFLSKHQVITYMTEGVTTNVENTTLVVNLYSKAFKQFLNEKLSLSSGQFLLASIQGAEVFHNEHLPDQLLSSLSFSNALQQDQGSFNFKSNNQELFVSFTKLNTESNWILFSIVPKSALLQETKSIQFAILWIVLGCLLVTFTVSQWITRLLLTPLKNLQALMLKVEFNDLSVRFEDSSRDEFSQAGHRFNRMLSEIQRLMEQVVSAEEQKRISEMKALQAQIDPHFLYNTLNTIYWKSQMNQLEDVQEMVLSLSSLFQLGLNRGKEITTLENELLHVEQYLIIQQKCYEELFHYSIHIGDQVDKSQPILKLLLQPLVENCILHGFQDRNEGGIISINLHQTNSLLQITVTDNGQGIKDDNLLANSTEMLKGYALSNITQRLMLEYGDAASFQVSSEYGIGTVITLYLPLKINTSVD
ncbi:sensor histidine kinase [Paenibacillus sp. IITD108]|uniref:sensor histidine kinase n=1 Tax=Paenibacillus sp. IITD108 TaxID=3116649 RepID=UPI002F3E5593